MDTDNRHMSAPDDSDRRRARPDERVDGRVPARVRSTSPIAPATRRRTSRTASARWPASSGWKQPRSLRRRRCWSCRSARCRASATTPRACGRRPSTSMRSRGSRISRETSTRVGVDRRRRARAAHGDRRRPLHRRWYVELGAYALAGGAVTPVLGGGWREIVAGAVVGLLVGRRRVARQAGSSCGADGVAARRRRRELQRRGDRPARSERVAQHGHAWRR